MRLSIHPQVPANDKPEGNTGVVTQIMHKSLYHRLVRRVHVHALTLYASPLVFASAATGTQGQVPGATISTEPTISSILNKFLGSLDFSQVLILLLVGSLFFKDEIRAALKKYFGLNFGRSNDDTITQPELKNMDAKMTQLQTHYNDETTHLLTDILGVLRSVREEQTEQSKSINSIISKVEEIIKYGVPERRS